MEDTYLVAALREAGRSRCSSESDPRLQVTSRMDYVVVGSIAFLSQNGSDFGSCCITYFRKAHEPDPLGSLI